MPESTPHAADPVGVLDSGLGGLSVLRALRHRLPEEDFLYCADCGNAPWGDKPAAWVVERCDRIAQFLVSVHGVKALVLACNTATAAAADHLRTWMYVLINPNSYNALPADLQAILTEGCKEMQDYEHELFLAEEAELLGMLEDAGMTVIEVDQNEFKEVLQSGVMPILTEKEVETLERIKAVDPNA